MNQVSSAFSRRSKNLLRKPAKDNTYRSTIKIPTLYYGCMVDSCLHCKFRNGAWRPRAAFQDRVLSFEDRIIYIDSYIETSQLLHLYRAYIEMLLTVILKNRIGCK